MYWSSHCAAQTWQTQNQPRDNKELQKWYNDTEISAVLNLKLFNVI